MPSPHGPAAELTWHWGMAYRIWAADGIWYACRDDHDEIIQATDPERLSFMIRDDYFRRAGRAPLPRRSDPRVVPSPPE